MGCCSYTAAVNVSLRAATGRWGILGAAAALVYVVLIGGTSIGELDPRLWVVNAGIAGAFLVWYLVRAPAHADRSDRAVLLAVIVFAAAAVLSQFPRQSFDAVLAALTYAAGLFAARGILAAAPARAILVRSLMALSLLVTFTTAALWLPLFFGWWQLTDWGVIPPFDLAVPSEPWGHRHDLALLTAMLYPSWWIGRPSPLRAAAATVLGVLGFTVVIVDGSRTLWLAVAVATAAVGAPPAFRAIRRSRRLRFVLLASSMAGACLLLVTGVAGSLLDRTLNINTLSARSAMWGSLTEVWLANPVAGLGPGSFPWALQQTDYFNTHTWAPRHPDSALFQLLPEAGLLGLIAATCLAFAFVPAVLRSRSAAAQWSLVAFGVAGIGANPTDFAFLVVVAVAWIAYAQPRQDLGPRTAHQGARVMRALSFAALAAIGAAYLATVGAGFSYASAREAANRDDLPAAARHLSSAITLDPGMALYWRQRGVARLLAGQPATAVSDLMQATSHNSSDDMGWRTLALALRDAEEPNRAGAALDEAIRTHRADPTNLLLRAQWALDAGQDPVALEALAEIVQAWPATVSAPAWDALVSSSEFTTEDVIEAAMDRWDRKLGASDGNLALLAILADRGDVISRVREGDGRETALNRATIASYQCDPSVREILATASDSDRRDNLYWELLIRDASTRGGRERRAERLFQLMTGVTLDPAGAETVLDPLGENDIVGFSADRWGYRRSSIAWPPYEDQLPSPAAGIMRWRLDPRGASDAAGTADASPCR